MQLIKMKSKWLKSQLFGLPFFLAGLFFLIMGLNPAVDWQPQRPSLLFLIPFTSIFMLIGLGILGGMRGFEINPVMGRGKAYWGIFFPLWTKKFALSQIKFIQTEREVRRTKNSSYYVYVVRLLTQQEKKIHLFTFRSSAPARETAERIARQCKIDLMDVDSHKITKASEVDPAYYTKVKDLKIDKPQLPTNSSLIKVPSSTGVILQFKEKFNLPILIILISASSFIFFPLFYFTGLDKLDSPLFSTFFLLIFFSPLLMIFFKWLSFKTQMVQLKVQKGLVEITRKGLFGKRVLRLSPPDIDDISCPLVTHPESFEKIKVHPLFSKMVSRKIDIIAHGESHRLGPLEKDGDLRYLYSCLQYFMVRNT